MGEVRVGRDGSPSGGLEVDPAGRGSAPRRPPAAVERRREPPRRARRCVPLADVGELHAGVRRRSDHGPSVGRRPDRAAAAFGSCADRGMTARALGSGASLSPSMSGPLARSARPGRSAAGCRGRGRLEPRRARPPHRHRRDLDRPARDRRRHRLPRAASGPARLDAPRSTASGSRSGPAASTRSDRERTITRSPRSPSASSPWPRPSSRRWRRRWRSPPSCRPSIVTPLVLEPDGPPAARR